MLQWRKSDDKGGDQITTVFDEEFGVIIVKRTKEYSSECLNTRECLTKYTSILVHLTSERCQFALTRLDKISICVQQA